MGVGIDGMRERVRDLGGILTFDGHGGTTVIVEIPLASRSCAVELPIKKAFAELNGQR